METKKLSELKADIINTSATAQPVKVYSKWWAKIQECNTHIGELIKDGDFFVTRNEIFEIQDDELKAIKCLMWGYPEIRRIRKNLISIFKDENWKKLLNLLSEYKEKNISAEEFASLYKNLSDIKGLGPSSWTKLLYFFKVSVNGDPCLVFDRQIELYLNKKGISEIAEHPHFKKWNHNKLNDYIDYIKQMKVWADSLEIPSDKLELYFFIDQHRK